MEARGVDAVRKLLVAAEDIIDLAAEYGVVDSSRAAAVSAFIHMLRERIELLMGMGWDAPQPVWDAYHDAVRELVERAERILEDLAPKNPRPRRYKRAR